eukprot:CAMPEP_0202979482 /NCGR_PEP_ID=MMETSP1396-20130829/85612_1 /ASSEMBLY_ACC=CAM_ASM_000872 /TAXON_ID= /ORGANISM="Pseudokeronopsis sp., Strain Brazil" /LENGTH=96 /DNA_ID=CAMNT_0049718909 /DNA_START=475 /DNA_END=765 /DNA_ORIENTATION=-
MEGFMGEEDPYEANKFEVLRAKWIQESKVPSTAHHKHISPFQSRVTWDSMEGFMGEEDPYEANKFEVLRAKWIQESKVLFGEFKPAKTLKSLQQPN